jgi:DNA-binding protein H-NS
MLSETLSDGLAMTKLNDLVSQRQAIDAQIAAEKTALIVRIHELMAEWGLTLEDLGGKPAPRNAKRTVKYRDESGRTWAGVGQRPRWLQARLLAGASLEQFRVNE